MLLTQSCCVDYVPKLLLCPFKFDRNSLHLLLLTAYIHNQAGMITILKFKYKCKCVTLTIIFVRVLRMSYYLTMTAHKRLYLSGKIISFLTSFSHVLLPFFKPFCTSTYISPFPIFFHSLYLSYHCFSSTSRPFHPLLYFGIISFNVKF